MNVGGNAKLVAHRVGLANREKDEGENNELAIGDVALVEKRLDNGEINRGVAVVVVCSEFNPPYKLKDEAKLSNGFVLESGPRASSNVSEDPDGSSSGLVDRGVGALASIPGLCFFHFVLRF